MVILDQIRSFFRQKIGKAKNRNLLELKRARATRMKTHAVSKEVKELEQRMNAMERELLRGRGWNLKK